MNSIVKPELKQLELLQPASTAQTMTVRMSVADWIAVPAFPYQRNTEARLEKAVKDHLAKFSPLHAIVQMVQLADGRRFKLDAHTRSLAWERGLIQQPDGLTVSIIHVQTMKEALELYKQIDSQKTVENSFDRAYGAGSGVGLRNADANSYARQGRYGTPAQLASAFRRGKSNPIASKDVYECVAEHKEAVEALIDICPNLHLFLTGVQTAFILTYEKYGPAALPFWRAYQNNQGSKIGNESDGIQALANYVNARRKKEHAGRNNDKHAYVCGVAISCFETYLRGETYKVTPRPTDPVKYLPL